MNIFALLAAKSTTEATGDILTSAYETFSGIVNIVLPVLAAFLLILGIILGVKVGVQFAQAEDDEAKKKAKGQLINLVIGFACGIVVSLLLWGIGTSNIVANLFK